MATSGTNTFVTTEADIIKDALLMLGVIDQEEAVSAGDYATGRRWLNMLTKMLAIKANLWVTTDVAHTLTPGTQSYTVGTGLNINTARPLRLEHARRSDGTTDIPISVISRQDYMDLPNKATQAACLQVYYDPQLANGVLYCWPTGDANNTSITLTFKRPLQDFTATGDNPDLPKEWYLPLVTLLAEKLAPQHIGSIPQWLKIEAMQTLAVVENWDEEDVSIMLSPSARYADTN